MNTFTIDPNHNITAFASQEHARAAKIHHAEYFGSAQELAKLPVPGPRTAPSTFKLPWEGHAIKFRAEAFNVFNNVNFYNPSLSLLAPLTFGEFQQTTPPREMQFALRYEF
jgi:hypothetical protein